MRIINDDQFTKGENDHMFFMRKDKLLYHR